MSTDARTLATKLAVIRAVQTAAALAEADTKAALEDALDPGDRKTAMHGGLQFGTVTYVKSTTKARVTDSDALLAYVADHHPGEVTTPATIEVKVNDLRWVLGHWDRQTNPDAWDNAWSNLDRQIRLAQAHPRVRDSYLAVLLKRAEEDGEAFDHDDGEPIPGIVVTPAGEGRYVQVRQSEEQRQAILEAYTAGSLDLVDLALAPVQIEAGS
jgi:hypothetical protein